MWEFYQKTVKFAHHLFYLTSSEPSWLKQEHFYPGIIPGHKNVPEPNKLERLVGQSLI